MRVDDGALCVATASAGTLGFLGRIKGRTSAAPSPAPARSFNRSASYSVGPKGGWSGVLAAVDITLKDSNESSLKGIFDSKLVRTACGSSGLARRLIGVLRGHEVAAERFVSNMAMQVLWEGLARKMSRTEIPRSKV